MDGRDNDVALVRLGAHNAVGQQHPIIEFNCGVGVGRMHLPIDLERPWRELVKPMRTAVMLQFRDVWL